MSMASSKDPKWLPLLKTKRGSWMLAIIYKNAENSDFRVRMYNNYNKSNKSANVRSDCNRKNFAFDLG